MGATSWSLEWADADRPLGTLRGWKCEGKLCPGRTSVLGPDAALVRFYDRLGDRQTKAGTGVIGVRSCLLAAIKPVKYVVDVNVDDSLA